MGCHAGVELVVAELDGCCYILRPDLVLERASDSSAVRWIAFAKKGHSTRCHWATDVQSEVILSLQCLCSENPRTLRAILHYQY